MLQLRDGGMQDYGFSFSGQRFNESRYSNRRWLNQVLDKMSACCNWQAKGL